MEHKTWTNVDKSAWGPGPWQQEPDKEQWVDQATGLPCLIVRNLSGALCGYVGVKPGHPWHGKDYYDCPASAHGGLTFASPCDDITPDAYQKFLSVRLPGLRAKALKFPQGDAAQILAEWEPHLHSFEAFQEYTQGRVICHVAEGHDAIWWLGFDCAHSGDLCPAMESTLRRCLPRTDSTDQYRDLAYVKAECASLAQQIAAQ